MFRSQSGRMVVWGRGRLNNQEKKRPSILEETETPERDGIEPNPSFTSSFAQLPNNISIDEGELDLSFNELPPLFGDDLGMEDDDLPLLEQSIPSSAGSDHFVDDAEERWNALQASMDEHEIASVVKSIKDINSYDFADLVRMMEERKRGRSEMESVRRKLQLSSPKSPAVTKPNMQYPEDREPNLTVSAGDDSALRNKNLDYYHSDALPQQQQPQHSRLRNWHVLRNLRRTLSPTSHDDGGLNDDKVSLMDEQHSADTARMRSTVLDPEQSDRPGDMTPPLSPTMFTRPETDPLELDPDRLCKPTAETFSGTKSAPVKKSDWRTFKIEKGLTCAQPTCMEMPELPGVNDYTFDIWNTSPKDKENDEGKETLTMLSEEETITLQDDLGQLSLQETLTQNEDYDDDDDAFEDIPLDSTKVIGIQSFNSLLHYENEEEERQMRSKEKDLQPYDMYEDDDVEQNNIQEDEDVDMGGRKSPSEHAFTSYMPSKAASPSIDDPKPTRQRPKRMGVARSWGYTLGMSVSEFISNYTNKMCGPMPQEEPLDSFADNSTIQTSPTDSFYNIPPPVVERRHHNIWTNLNSPDPALRSRSHESLFVSSTFQSDSEGMFPARSRTAPLAFSEKTTISAPPMLDEDLRRSFSQGSSGDSPPRHRQNIRPPRPASRSPSPKRK